MQPILLRIQFQKCSSRWHCSRDAPLITASHDIGSGGSNGLSQRSSDQASFGFGSSSEQCRSSSITSGGTTFGALRSKAQHHQKGKTASHRVCRRSRCIVGRDSSISMHWRASAHMLLCMLLYPEIKNKKKKKSCAPPKACVDVNLFAKLCSEIGVLVSACSLPGEC